MTPTAAFTGLIELQRISPELAAELIRACDRRRPARSDSEWRGVQALPEVARVILQMTGRQGYE